MQVKRGAILILSLLFGLTVAYLVYSYRPVPRSVEAAKNPTVQMLATEEQKGFAVMGRPLRLKIDALDIDAPIRKVGILSNGEMAMPDNLYEVGWYMQGAAPGNPGKAVLAAHSGFPWQPTLFKNVEQLKSKDTLSVTDDQNQQATFEVIDTGTYQPDKAPLSLIFGDSSTERLSLIICTGDWDDTSQTYSHRFVAYAVRSK